MTKKNLRLTNLEEVGTIDVDSGSVWIGDPCYIIKDKHEDRPTDLGEEWSDVCNKFFDRSGYNDAQREWHNYDFQRSQYVFQDPRWRSWMETESENSAHHRPGTPEYNAKRELIAKLHQEFEVTNPDPKIRHSGAAAFNHDLGHSGMGIMTDTMYGDGSYPVYVERNKEGRIKRVVIDFEG
jgi:hypothetical protein